MSQPPVPPMPDSNGGAPDVDTTLLESLFYNEMMMLDDSSELLSGVVTGAGAVETNASVPAPTTTPPTIPNPLAPFQQVASKNVSTFVAAAPAPVPESSGEKETSEDPITYAEQTLLRDFGVTDSPFPHMTDSTNQANPEDQNGQQPQHQPPKLHSERQSHGPNRYPPQQQQQQQQQYPPPNHYPPGQPVHQYPANGNTTPKNQGYASHQQPIQPRPSPPTRRVSKGIKHSVTPRTASTPSPKSQKPLTSNSSPQTIPNPLANQHQSQPPPPPHTQHQPQPASSYAHQTQPPSQPPVHPPPPPYHAHPHHQAYPHHPAYHYRHPSPPAGAHTPSLVPVPAPAPPGHHPQSAYGHPLHGSAPPHPYSSRPAAPPPHGTTGHATPHAHPHTPVPPHHHPHPNHHHHPHPHTYLHAHAHNAQPSKDQLVSQFATLANRLGINLPSNLLSSLTESAGMASATTGATEDAKNSKKGAATGATAPYGAPVPFNGQAPNSSYAPRPYSSGSKPPSKTSGGDDAVPSANSADSAVEALRKTAEEAVSAVTRKRSSEDSTTLASKISPQQQSEGNNANSKSAYAKRRKKPRLADCESRLAHLRAENEKLKRHLDNITNQTKKFEQDRVKAEITMKQMMENNDTPDEELDAVIREYSEAYSDYGRRRHEELSFHLDQLQKLANPTNFTKMGLWTIAKANDSKDLSKQNPLVGIMGRELDITPQQTRKIVEQRDKIRALCCNLNATMGLIDQLKDLCEQKNKKFNDRMNKTREILTPKQVVKLIMWIKDYSDVLESICPGWTSEQVVKTKTPAPLASATLEAPVSDPMKSVENNHTPEAPTSSAKEEAVKKDCQSQ